MRKLLGRTARKIAASLGILAVAASTLGATAPSPTSPGTLHEVALKQLTGTPDFDAAAGAGRDVSATNDVIPSPFLVDRTPHMPSHEPPSFLRPPLVETRPETRRTRRRRPNSGDLKNDPKLDETGVVRLATR